MNWGAVADVLANICLLGGAFLVFTAGVGAFRFPDLMGRIHAATKPQVLGVLLALLGLGLRIRSGSGLWMLALAGLFALITAPVSGHMISRAGMRTGKFDADAMVVNELADDLHASQSSLADHDESDGLPPVAGVALTMSVAAATPRLHPRRRAAFFAALYALVVVAPIALLFLQPQPDPTTFRRELSVALGFAGLSLMGIQSVPA